MTVRTLLCTLFAFCLLAPAGFAGSLADLPWDESIDADIRGAVRRALDVERRELGKEENEHGKKFVHVRTNEFVEMLDETTATTTVAINRCFDDKMVSEHWVYTLKPKEGSPDYEIVEREKIYEFDDYLPNLVELPAAARPLPAFEINHDKLKLKMNPGQFVASFRGPHPTELLIAATGHLRIDPVSDYEKRYFEREMKDELIDEEVEAVEITFDERNFGLLETIFGTSERPKRGQTEGSVDGDGVLAEMVRAKNPKEKRAYSPGEYSAAPVGPAADWFQLRIKTRKHGWLIYYFDPRGAPPTGLREVVIAREISGFSFNQGADDADIISHYYDDESRAMPLRDRENRDSYSLVKPVSTSAMISVDQDGVKGIASVELVLQDDTDRIATALMGDSRYRYVREDGVTDLPFTTSGSRGVLIRFPEARKAGDRVRLEIGYETKWAKFGNQRIGKISEGFWLFPREQAFLPFQSVLDSPFYLHLVVRTKDDYEHVAVGNRLREEVDDGWRYTEWGSDKSVNFPNLIIGQFYDPVIDEIDGIKITGYMTNAGIGSEFRPKRNDMIKQVDLAKYSLQYFRELLDAPYPFDELKLVSTPFSGAGAQSPSSTVFIGEAAFYSPALLADSGIPPSFVEGLTPHEVAHQWWGGLVTSRNGGHYWFVESLAELSAALFEGARNGTGEYHTSLDKWRRDTLGIDWTASVYEDLFRPSSGMRAQPLRYSKGPYVMHMLGEYFGRDGLVRYLRNVLKNHSGDYITTWDLQRTAEETFQVNMSWFFDNWIRGNGVPEVTYEYETRAAEDGKSWVVEGSLSQVVMLQNEPVPGEFFDNLLVPFTIELADGTVHEERKMMSGPSERFAFSVPGRPKTITINDHGRMLIVAKKKQG